MLVTRSFEKRASFGGRRAMPIVNQTNRANWERNRAQIGVFSLASICLPLLRLSEPLRRRVSPRGQERSGPSLEHPILLDQHRRLATYDAFVDTATASVADAGSSQRSIALLVADVDHYRRLSDEYGQPYAESVLRIILDLARANLREGELVSYRGGDEFVALLRASPPAAQRVAERVCAAVRRHPFPQTHRGRAPRATIS